METSYIDLDNGYIVVYDDTVDFERINLDKIKMCMESDGYRHSVYLYDFYVQDPRKRIHFDVCNRYSLLEQHIDRPCIVLRNELMFPLNAVCMNWLWQWDFLWWCATNDKSIKNVRTSIYKFPKDHTRDSNLAVEEWKQRIAKVHREQGYSVDHLGGYNNRIWCKNKYEDSVAIIIPSKSVELIEQCVRSIDKCFYTNYHIHIAWNGLPAAVPLWLQMHKKVSVHCVTLSKFNYSQVCNNIYNSYCKAFNRVLLCNDDIEIINPAFIEEMINIQVEEGADIVGAALYYPGGWTYNRLDSEARYQHASIVLHDVKRFDHLHKNKKVGKYYVPTMEVAAVTFALAMITSDCYASLGGMDEEYYGDCSDVEFCVRAKVKGRKVWYCAQAEAIHHESVTRLNDPQMQNDQGSIEYYNKNEKLLKRLFA
jgi:hypothetical protein